MTLCRRSFLGSLVFGLVGSARRQAHCGLSVSPEPPPWKIAIGLNGFGSSARHFKKTYKLDEILAFARDEGFDGVELWAPMVGGYPDPSEKARIQNLKDQFRRYNQQIFSIQTGGNSASPDPEARRRYVDQLKKYIDTAHLLGCIAVGIWPPAKKAIEGIPEDRWLDWMAESYRQGIEHARTYGMFLAIEGEPPLAIDSPERYLRLLERVNAEDLKIIYDPSHFDTLTGSTGRPEEMLRRTGVSRIGYVQLTDGDGTLFEGTSRHLPVGQGKYDIPASLRILHDGGFRGWIQIDTWMEEDPYLGSREGQRAVRRFMKSIG